MKAVKRFTLVAVASAAILGSLVVPTFAAKPADPSCLGADVSTFAQAQPFGQNVVINFTSGGFGEEVLAHLQGVPLVSTCPDNGFPTP